MVLILAVVFLGGGCKIKENGSVTITSEPGVEEEALKVTQKTIDAGLDYFKSRFNVQLQKDVRLILVKDSNSYKQAQLRELKASNADAEFMAKSSAGISGNNIIIMNTEYFNNSYYAGIVIGHELVHIFQNQIGHMQDGELMWYEEGVAEVITANITDQGAGLEQKGLYRHYLQRVYDKYQVRPRLDEIENYEKLSGLA